MGQSIEKEIAQTKPFPTLQQEVLVNLFRTAAVLSHRFESELKPLGLTVTQFNVLRILRGADNAGLCQHQIRDRLVAQVPDVPRLLKRMEESGLIRQRRAEKDRRAVVATIARGGLDLLSRLDEILDDVHRDVLQNLSETQLRKLNRLLVLAR